MLIKLVLVVVLAYLTHPLIERLGESWPAWVRVVVQLVVAGCTVAIVAMSGCE